MWQLHLQIRGAAEQAFAIDRPCTLGRGEAGLRAEALEESLTARPVGSGVVIETASSPLVLGTRRIAPATPRLVRPGDRVEGDGFVLRVTSEAEPGTRALAGAILAGLDPEPGDGPWVLVLEGADAGRRFRVEGDAVVGRGAGCTIRLADARTSRRHLALERRAGELLARDLRSKNGVAVNGRRVGRRGARLRGGDEIELGRTLLLLERGGEVARPSPRSPTPPSDGPGPRRVTAAVVFASLALLAAALILLGAAG